METDGLCLPIYSEYYFIEFNELIIKNVPNKRGKLLESWRRNEA